MTKQITVYYDDEGPDLKTLITKLARKRGSSYYRRSVSAIAGMLLQEKLEEVMDPEARGAVAADHGAEGEA